MKKVFLFLLICSMLLLCGCDPATYYFDYEALKDDVSAIERISYDNASSEMIAVEADSKLIFDSTKITASKVLDAAQVDAFLKELSKIVFHLKSDSTLEPVRECLRITMKNGNFIILSATMVGKQEYSMVAEFDAGGNFVKHVAHFAAGSTYEALLEKYFG